MKPAVAPLETAHRSRVKYEKSWKIENLIFTAQRERGFVQGPCETLASSRVGRSLWRWEALLVEQIETRFLVDAEGALPMQTFS